MNTIIASFFAAIASLILVVIPAQMSRENNERSPEPLCVYAKIILPVESVGDESHPIVESWIAKKLNKREESDLRAVTEWIRLENDEDTTTPVWNATVDGKAWGCPVDGRVAELTDDGKLNLEFSGWSPIGAEIKGQTLRAEIGSRRIAVVNTGRVDQEGRADQSGLAYIALFVGPAPPEPTSKQKP